MTWTRAGGGPRPRRFVLTVKLDDCFSGRTLSVALDGGERCRVRLEPGAADGDVVRARARDGGAATFEVREAPHERYTRRGADLLLDARVPLADALGGAPRGTRPPVRLISKFAKISLRCSGGASVNAS